ncbi:hypothetical protein JAAARDRAFT_605406 [Jaapia argillacea MUCL 33604]|uniref:Uncharacterized protein n=1 Tax=Jaapia argillacea MUCL 33604 TaxID=933084 RepID=A0A067QA56_9AGAM|nr:hypothetical protein JAAARDRAFT_605406 [Jaapia argillacea MUCL 33604]
MTSITPYYAHFPYHRPPTSPNAPQPPTPLIPDSHYRVTPALAPQHLSDPPSDSTNSLPALTHDDNITPDVTPNVPADPRRCTVRGCVTMLPPNYKPKMCEACRGRHRVYATTKRARRKLEKAAVTGNGDASPVQQQQQTWERSGGSSESSVPLSGHASTSPEQSTPYTYPPPTPWVPNDNIDPRLFTNTSSELAGALHLPTSSGSSEPRRSHYREHVTCTPQAPNPHPSPPKSPSLPPPNSHQHENDLEPEHDPDDQSPPSHPTIVRYCSVKGCKATLPTSYFFKMCEPCRDRYRGYGNTKRAKWKRERIAMKFELEKIREKEDKRREESGLPPINELPFNRRQDWEMKVLNNLQFRAKEGTLLSPTLLPTSTSPNTSPNTNNDTPTSPPSPTSPTSPTPTLGVKMCTVSHCHAILPSTYAYKRCDQHRLQNRYHSQLKRVREKEIKGAVLQEWMVVTGDPGGVFVSPDFGGEEGEEEGAGRVDGGGDDGGGGVDGEEQVTPARPPPIRGTRRSNHVCSVRQCKNLLDPKVPWKMCELCRARDRQVRNSKGKGKKDVVVVAVEEGGGDEEEGEGEGEEGERVCSPVVDRSLVESHDVEDQATQEPGQTVFSNLVLPNDTVPLPVRSPPTFIPSR